MAMVSDVALIWMPVQDTRRATTFYRDVLGLKVVKEQDDWAEMETDGLRIGLNGREPRSVRQGGGAMLTFHPQGSLDDAVQQLKSRGVEFPGDISEHPWGRVATFMDSEGNDLQLFEPPKS